MNPIIYRAVGRFRKRRKLKSGLAPTGVFRQIWYLHNSFQAPIYAADGQKTNRRTPSRRHCADARTAGCRAFIPHRTMPLKTRAWCGSFPRPTGCCGNSGLGRAGDILPLGANLRRSTTTQQSLRSRVGCPQDRPYRQTATPGPTNSNSEDDRAEFGHCPPHHKSTSRPSQRPCAVRLASRGCRFYAARNRPAIQTPRR